MKIAFYHSHTPYAAMLANAFPEHQFLVDNWAHFLRDQPENVTLWSYPEPLKSDVDVLIRDNFFSADTSDIKSGKKVFLIHCEQDHSPGSTEFLSRVFSGEFESIVSVSQHKRRTLRHLQEDPRLVTIRFSADFPERKSQSFVGRVGFVKNSIAKEMSNFIAEVGAGFECVTIGHGNEAWTGMKIVPDGFRNYVAELHTVDVFVNPVIGNSFGMTNVDALCSGIPVILGMSEDNPTMCVSGGNCVEMPKRANQCVVEIREWIRRLITDRELNAKMGQNGKAMAAYYFSPEEFRNRWLKVLS